MRILYIGVTSYGKTSSQRIEALRRLGHEVQAIDPQNARSNSWLSQAFHWRTGFYFSSDAVTDLVMSSLKYNRYDLVFVNHGESVNSDLIVKLRKFTRLIINYNTDDPTGKRDGNKWYTYKKSVPFYDLVVVSRIENVQEVKSLGAKNVLFELQCYDPIVHAPLSLTRDDVEKFKTDVLFLGSWEPERGPFLKELINMGVPLTVFGNGWTSGRRRNFLGSAFKGTELLGLDYTKAIQCAKICIGLVSIRNRDLITTRSFEIPAIGSLLCAKRTVLHEQFFRDGIDAMFWNTSRECGKICLDLLNNSEKIDKIAKSGHDVVLKSGRSNDEMLDRILNRALSLKK